jgi:hypothetical protein
LFANLLSSCLCIYRQRSFNEVKDQLVSEVMEECTRLKTLQKKLQAEHAQREGEQKSATRALRSNPVEISTGADSAKAKAKRKVREPSQQLNEVIPEASRRSDFLEIVRDLQRQAQSWNKQVFLLSL